MARAIQQLTKDEFLEIQSKLWDISPTYPDELSKEKWMEMCASFYDIEAENTEIQFNEGGTFNDINESPDTKK